jgi:hypothetical protein
MFVMAGLVPAIHVLLRFKKGVDAGHKAGHDVERFLLPAKRREKPQTYDLFAIVFQFAARFSAPRCDTAKIV